MKRLLSLLLSVFCLCVGLSGCAVQSTDITIYYTTDTHGRIFATEEAIGLSVTSALVKSDPGAILLDAGDFLHGAPAATLTEGYDVVKLMKLVGYSAVTVGNHEFSYGQDVFWQRMDQAQEETDAIPFLSANILKDDGSYAANPWIILEVQNMKVGIFGLTTPSTAWQAAPNAVEGLSFTDPEEAGRKAVEELQNEGCEVIIALTHLGSDEGIEVRSIDIARNISGIDAVIDGHSEVVLETEENGVPVVSVEGYGRMVGKLVLHIENAKVTGYTHSILTKDSLGNISPDEEVEVYASEIQTSQQEILNQIVGYTPITLIGADKGIVRTRETNLGNIAADALMLTTNADVGLMNSGNIRADILAGGITHGIVIEAFPYSNIVVTKEITGAQLLDILEHACGMLPAPDGRFAQVAGISFSLDVSDSPRVSDLRFSDGRLVQPDDIIVLATNDYIASGGDEYPHLADIPLSYQGMTIEEAFLKFLPSVDFSKYQNDSETRILQRKIN